MKTAVGRQTKPVQAIQASRHLGMAHRRHTGHVLPKRNTSYAVLAMIVLCVGVLLANWTRAVTADSASYVVHASVPGPPPSVGATIDTPLTSADFNAIPITVSGTCPIGTYVEILRNNFSSGIALCSASGTYSLQIDLFAGTNQLVARDYSFTDQPGPDSGVTTVAYTPPVTVSGGGTIPSQPYTPGSPNNTIAEPLLIKATYTFVGYYVGTPATWNIHVEGGSPPYAVSVDWGDGSNHVYALKAAQDLSLQHVYARSGAYHGSYPVKITASDAVNTQAHLQLLAIISNKPKTVGAGIASGNKSGGLTFTWPPQIDVHHVVAYLWSGYGLILLMLISFWLGERRERSVINNRRGRRHAT